MSTWPNDTRPRLGSRTDSKNNYGKRLRSEKSHEKQKSKVEGQMRHRGYNLNSN